MRYKIGNNKFIYLNLNGNIIDESKFDGKSCLKDDEGLDGNGNANIHVFNNGITISENNKPTTTVTTDGKVINNDKDSQSIDSAKDNQLIKPNETTVSSVNDDKVMENDNEIDEDNLNNNKNNKNNKNNNGEDNQDPRCSLDYIIKSMGNLNI